MKILRKIQIFSLLLTAMALAAPPMNEYLERIGKGSKFTMLKEVNILPNVSSLGVGEPEPDGKYACTLYLKNVSEEDRVIRVGKELIVSGLAPHIGCNGPYSKKCKSSLVHFSSPSALSHIECTGDYANVGGLMEKIKGWATLNFAEPTPITEESEDFPIHVENSTKGETHVQ